MTCQVIVGGILEITCRLLDIIQMAATTCTLKQVFILHSVSYADVADTIHAELLMLWQQE